MVRSLVAVLAVMFALTGPLAFAGAFFETDGIAIGGYDPVAYFVGGTPGRGDPAFTADYKGSKFQFKNAANRDRFVGAPEKYAPQYGGYCAFGVTGGYKAVTSPEAFTVIDGKLYLNHSAKVQAMWTKDIPGFIQKADEKWGDVEKTSKVMR